VERTYSAYFWHRKYGRLRPSFHDELEFALTHEEDFSKHGLRLQTSLYSYGVKRYMKVFDPKHVKILIFEEWIKDAKNTVNEIIRFLGLNYDITNMIQETYNPYAMSRGVISQKILGSSRIRKVSNSLFRNSTKDFLKKILIKKGIKPKMHEGDRKKLIKFYQNDVKELEKLLEHKLPWSNF